MFNLTAKLSLVDNFTSKMKGIESRTKQTESAMSKLTRSVRGLGRTNRAAGSSFHAISKGASSASSGVGKLIGTLGGLAAAYGAVSGAKKLFESTVWQAAQRQQSNVMIDAMFNDKKLAKQYTSMLDRIAIDSPVLDSKAMYENSKGFISTTKDVQQLEKMWSLAERMAAIDPMQGTEGAVFALREMFSGDSQSMVERFEMPRKVMNDIKNMELPQQLEALDKYFNKIGMTQKLINEMGDTTIGKWQQVKEQMALTFSSIGKPSLDVLSGFFDDVLERLKGPSAERFAEVGARWMQSILNGLTNSIVTVYDWFTALTASEEFKKQTTTYAKVSFIIDDLYQRFMEWLEGPGGEKIAKVTEKLIDALSVALKSAAPSIASAAIEVGAEIGKGIGKGMSRGLEKAVEGTIFETGVGNIGEIQTKVMKPNTAKLHQIFENSKSHNGGLDRVPYSGYKANLHRDEMVLTRQEASDYRQAKKNGGGLGGGVTVGSINMYGVGGDMKKAARELMEHIADEIQLAGGAGA